MHPVRLAALAVLLACAAITAADAHDYTLGAIKIGHPWTRATPPRAKVGGGYLTLTNTGTTPDRLVAASVDAAATTQFHEMAMKDGIMSMRALPNGIEIKPGATVEFKPNAFHVMMIDLKEQLKQGTTIKGRLVFEKAGAIEIEYVVEAMGSTHPPASADKGKMDDMPSHGP